MLAIGDSISSQKALEIGLVDGLWDASREEDCLSSCVQQVLSHPGVRSGESVASVDRLQEWKEIASNPASIGIGAIDTSNNPSGDATPPMTLRSRETIAKAITTGLEHGFAEGCRCERELFYGLLSQADVQQGLQRFAPRKPASSS
jgi:enoyl-CoA hydratase/carnithine racemase